MNDCYCDTYGFRVSFFAGILAVLTVTSIFCFAEGVDYGRAKAACVYTHGSDATVIDEDDQATYCKVDGEPVKVSRIK